MTNGYDLLRIVPKNNALDTPVIDQLTSMMTAALRKCRRVSCEHGITTCSCGVRDSGEELILQGETGSLITTSLCVHFLAFHRDEVPSIELAKVANLRYGTAEPTVEELVYPQAIGSAPDRVACR
ncbi:hypothetical protein KKF59_02405 [Patescibacteria group bacterium]|nr:hypothetical protein [Patescibacteria group bacterium]MBU1034926.1 hypothetical protein [Patescibacteria group bacterium]MBU1629877.1 hypothetical protein [Patescibacteria group bacterium]MBU1907962.1 hypothetical protein [Patescibacteria group bacterium]